MVLSLRVSFRIRLRFLLLCVYEFNSICVFDVEFVYVHVSVLEPVYVHVFDYVSDFDIVLLFDFFYVYVLVVCLVTRPPLRVLSHIPRGLRSECYRLKSLLSRQ